MSQVQTSSYPILEDVMQGARAGIMDMLKSTAGAILTDTSPYTIVFVNSAIRRVQRRLANNGITSNVRDNVILTPLTPAANADPSVQVYVSVLGYFDGVNVNAQPTLPADLILPLELWERQTGSGAQFQPMSRPQEGLTSRMPGSYFGQWEWREDRINMTGSTMTEDLRVRYEASLPRIAPGTDFTKTTIAIRDGEDALSSAVKYEYAKSRSSAMRQEAKETLEEDLFELINRYVHQDQRIGYRPRGFRAGSGRIDGALQGEYK
jgi:hypothetical protein